MSRYHSLTELVGHTPILDLDNYGKRLGLAASISAKLEYLNPAGSVKDRVALRMIEQAEASGALAPGALLIEPTSGNTGIGIAAVAAARGYRAMIVMPDSMSVERRVLMKAYGAELVLTEGRLGMKGAIERAREIQAATPGSMILGQFTNSANPLAHFETTGPEIWSDMGGQVDFFVAGAGTGGTITGTGRYLKSVSSSVRVVAVEPATSAVLSGGKPGAHGLQGIGAGFIPEILDRSVIDEIFTVTNEQAYEAARLLAATEGVLTGITSGAALHAATVLARRPGNAGKRIVVLLPDTGDRYLSTPLYADL